jgi:rhamnose utilization protein RhaD (predicted bifunctional aldolase and dehydrogenase)
LSALAAASWAPDLVSGELLELTRTLGDPALDLAIVAEGNTSERIDDNRLVVKASGSAMRHATASDFVVVDVPSLRELLSSATITQAQLTQAVEVLDSSGRVRRGSIETALHVAIQAVRPVRFIAHTHPTAVLSLLASVRADTAFADPVYSDEAVVLGRPLHLGYAEPGLAVAQLLYRELWCYVDRYAALPSLVLMANHGIVAIAETAVAAESITLMATKSARIRAGAYAVGGVVPLSADATEKYTGRPEIAQRRQQLSGTR